VLLVLPFSDALDLGKYFLVVRAPLEGSASDLLVCEALSGSPWCHCSVFQSYQIQLPCESFVFSTHGSGSGSQS
jgi:hypothetical protein